MRTKIIIFFLVVIFIPILASATTISPPIIEIELDPGQSGRYFLTLFNETDLPLYLDGYIEIFESKGERGEVEIVSPSVAYQSLSWLKLPTESIDLRPGDIAKVPLTVDVPQTAEVGGYYLAAMWEASLGPKVADSQIGISSRVGTLIFLRVKGEAEEDISIIDFGLSVDTDFYSHLPVAYTSRLSNLGTVHLKPAGSIVIKNIFGRVTAVLPFNPDKRNILPQSNRQFDNVWQRRSGVSDDSDVWSDFLNEITQFSFGRYSAQLDLEYGDSRQRAVSDPVTFYVIPWRIISVIIIFIVLMMIFKRIKKQDTRKQEINKKQKTKLKIVI